MKKEGNEEALFISIHGGWGNRYKEMCWIHVYCNNAVPVGRFKRLKYLYFFGWKAFFHGHKDITDSIILRKNDLSIWPFGKKIPYALDRESTKKYYEKIPEWIEKRKRRENR